MSREIKFRAWGGSAYEYDVAVGKHSGDSHDCKPTNTVVILDDGDCWYEPEPSVVVEQYTGLKDANGVEIYEGDRLRKPSTNQWEAENYLSYEVFFHGNDAAPYQCVGFKIGRMKTHGSLAGGIGDYRLLPEVTRTLIVIGNIHENPELLEVTP